MENNINIIIWINNKYKGTKIQKVIKIMFIINNNKNKIKCKIKENNKMILIIRALMKKRN